jgi:protein N-terminal glutamine amidohydrolase
MRLVCSSPVSPPYAGNYWPSYCEENVWHLCATSQVDWRSAVLISNANRTVYFHGQRAGQGADKALVWDYHVICLERRAKTTWVLDADCAHGFEMPLTNYLSLSFPELGADYASWRPRFRVIDGIEYRDGLASNRSHMRDANGAWLARPPPWACIGDGHNLGRLIDLDDSSSLGTVMDYCELRKRFVA